MDITTATTTFTVAGKEACIEVIPRRTTMQTTLKDSFMTTIETDTVIAKFYEVMDDSPALLSEAEWNGYYDEPMAEWAAEIRYKDNRDVSGIIARVPEKKRHSRVHKRVSDTGENCAMIFCTSIGEAFAILEDVVRLS